MSNSGARLGRLEGHQTDICSIYRHNQADDHPDEPGLVDSGGTFATAGCDGTVLVWSVGTILHWCDKQRAAATSTAPATAPAR